MNGAYCLDCRELGPDLTLKTDPQALDVPLIARVEFTCGGCGARWRWRASVVPGGWMYDQPVRLTGKPS